MTNESHSTKPASAANTEKETREAREERLRSLRAELSAEPLYREAQEAAVKLGKAGCDLGVAMGYLNRIGGYATGNLGP